ncbi:hypothetical protein HDV01_004900 [Terramyces sp. JEL0728]|nr:hypothetical protein HDV01_004900 [Terramyces sp. JEL0728]
MKKKYIDRHLEIAVNNNILSRKTNRAKRKPLNIDQFIHILQLENKNIVGLFQRILALVNINQRNLLELTLFSVKYNEIVSINDKLAGFISLYPYNEDSELLGYAGLVSLLVYQKKKQSRYITQAIQLLKSSISLSANMMFMNILQDIMKEDDFVEYLSRLPRDINVLLKVGEMKNDYSTLIEFDPVCDLKIFFSHINQLDKRTMITKLADRLEYENNARCWKLLITKVLEDSYYETDECRIIFADRDWWGECFSGMYFFILFDLLGKKPRNTIDGVDDLEIWELYKNEIYY